MGPTVHSVGGELRYAAKVPWLEGCGENVYSQFGEDGLIAAILERIGTTNKECFEVGAGDGKEFSNTRRLVELGWHALWIESSAELFMKLIQDIPGDVDAIPVLITPENANGILRSLPADMDLGVIDIDGNDYAVWEAMEKRPRVMMVEYKPESYGKQGKEQAALEEIVELGTTKGYQLLATTFCNALFARSDVL